MRRAMNKTVGQAEPMSARGVFEARRPLTGYRSFTVVDSRGETLLRMEVVERTGPAVLAGLWTLLDDIDPVANLSLLPVVQVPARRAQTRATRFHTPARLELV